MKISISGDELFRNRINRYHNEFTKIILLKMPKYRKVENILFSVVQTSKLDVAGRVSFTNKQISINACLTYNNPTLLKELYGHELAHCFSTLFHNRNIQHGKEWVEIMNVLGLKPRTELKLSQAESIAMECHLATCKCIVNNQKLIHRKKVSSLSVCNLCLKKYIIR